MRPEGSRISLPGEKSVIHQGNQDAVLHIHAAAGQPPAAVCMQEQPLGLQCAQLLAVHSVQTKPVHPQKRFL